jgi:hypothetical protein
MKVCIALAVASLGSLVDSHTAHASDPKTASLESPEYQEPKPPDPPESGFSALYVEGLGPGYLYSINFEQRVDVIAFRLGFGELSGFTGEEHYGSSSTPAYNSGSFAVLPLSISYLGIGSRVHVLEAGAGATAMFLGEGQDFNGYSTGRNESKTLFIPHASIGYRFKQFPRGVLLRIGGCVFIAPKGDAPVLPWPYLAFGAAF